LVSNNPNARKILKEMALGFSLTKRLDP